jgi:hypothetical protein
VYSDGNTKGFLFFLLAIVLIIAGINWRTSLFILRLLWDLVVIHLRPYLQQLANHFA